MDYQKTALNSIGYALKYLIEDYMKYGLNQSLKNDITRLNGMVFMAYQLNLIPETFKNLLRNTVNSINIF